MPWFVLGYLTVSWLLFAWQAERDGNSWSIDERRVDHLLYRIPRLSEDPVLAFGNLFTGPFLNHDAPQMLYVTVLLALFGASFETREGTRRAALVFFGSTLAASVGAGLVLHLIYPEFLDATILRRAWERTWSGGSAGAFGLMGALAGRARRPWPLLALFVLWEATFASLYRIYTPAFHLVALATGFVVGRRLARRAEAAGRNAAPGPD